MSDFEKRLQKAIERGHQKGTVRAEAEAKKALSEQELRRLHSKYRLELSEHIEECLRRIGEHFPGFHFETIVSDRGWGAAVSRDDVGRKRKTHYSRLELLIRPLSEYYVLDLASKGTIRNKELFNRNHFERLAEADLTSFVELIDLWTLEYAEVFAAKS